MVENFATCLLMGNNFSPSKLKQISELNFYSPIEKGTINKRNGEKWEHGSAIINCPKHINKEGEDIELSDLLNALIKNKEALINSGVEDIDITLVLGHDGKPSAWHIEYEDLKKLVDLRAGLSLDLYQAGSKEDYEEEFNDDEETEI